MTQPISRVVWSFWSEPFRRDQPSIWLSKKHHFLAWVLSVEEARKHYPKTALVTDDAGARQLIDGIGLEFDSVSTDLNVLQQGNPKLWMLGKLHAYRAQTEPFVHLDYDVFLWKPLPEIVAGASVFAQNPEFFAFDDSRWWYRPEFYYQQVRQHQGWLPPEFKWYVEQQGTHAACCGFLGGNAVGFLRHYADTAIHFIEHPNNQEIWSRIDDIGRDNTLFEQYLLCACIAYHNAQETSAFRDVDIRYLFASSEEAFFSPQKAKQVGYTHLLGGAKRNPVLLDRLEKRVARDYPQHYEHCLRYLQQTSER